VTATPGGSLPVAMQIIRKPRNWVQPHVPPGGSSCGFWKIPENANRTRIQSFHNSNM